ncbi:hypothetical protein [Xanthomonas arboricola]|uniref:hypothetical protein n=1 Tax=Xanthomonas arboricola TaxID=56448 RepID=UPI001430F896|nr:hypothetical protein [Xanthomonas arboricola]NJB77665.1 hypothetical protein [Xanthomonas arboricola]
MNAIEKNDIYCEFVMSSLTADLKAKGYAILTPSAGGADWIVSKPNVKPFAVEFRSYKDLRYFLDSPLTKDRRNTRVLGRELPVSYVGVDSADERVAVERGLMKKLGPYASRLNLKEYVVP